MTRKRYLFVFDFDHTIINENTDGVIIRKLEDITGCEKERSNDEPWSQVMSSTLHHLAQHHFTRSDIDNVITDIPLTPGFNEVFNLLRKILVRDDTSSEDEHHDCFILSHSNDYFIDILLEKYGVKDIFHTVHTYASEWVHNTNMENNSADLLCVHPYDDPPNTCTICSNDFCKGNFLDTHVVRDTSSSSSRYDCVVYVGDGGADYCAALRLQSDDVVLMRKDYAMHRRLKRDGDHLMRARHVLWENGTDIVTTLEELLKV